MQPASGCVRTVAAVSGEDVIVKTVFFKQIAAAVATLVIAVSAWALSDDQRDAMISRIEPAGKVCMKGDSSCGAAVASSGGGAQSGQEVYETSCQACHGTGAGNAPKYGDAAAWADRIAKGMDTLYVHAIEGFNDVGMMPPKGMCMSCSDDEVKAAVDYIVENSK